MENRNDMFSRYDEEHFFIESYTLENSMVYQLIDKELIIVTDIAYWKITYLPDWQTFALYHGNSIPKDVNPMSYVEADYHFQKDMKFGNSIKGLLIYIKRHDEFRLHQIENVEEMPRRTKKEKAQYKKLKQKEKAYNQAIVYQMLSAAMMVETSKLSYAV